jgi:PAS domain S-box-containing protein
VTDHHHSTVPKSSWHHLAQYLRRDQPTRITLSAVAAVVAFSFLPVAESLRVGALYSVTPIFLIWNIFWFGTRSRKAVGEERHFWIDLTCAAAAWCFGSVLLLMLADQSGLAIILTETVYAAIYVFLLRASDRTFHEPAEPNGSHWPMATFFVAGLFLYWVLPGALVEPGLSRSETSSRLLYISANGYLTIRLGYLAWRARGSWRAIFLILCTSTASLMVYAVARLFDEPTRFTQAQWYLPFLLWLIAARIPTDTHSNDRHVALPGTRRTALATGLVLPVIHFAGYGLHLLDPGLRDWREVLICAWLVVFGGLAITQRRRLHRHLRNLIDERRTLMRSSDTKTDLRVILEKRRTDEAVGQSAEKYLRAFNLCPDAIGISTLADGRFLEVNPAFERLTGYPREQILGRSSADLRIWLHTRDRDRIVERVRDLGTVRGLTLPFRANGGQRRIASFTAQPLDIDGEACVIIVGRELDRALATAELHTLPAPFADAPSPVFLVEHDGRVEAWNTAADHDGDASSMAPRTIASWVFENDPRAWSRLRRRVLRDRAVRTPEAIALVVDEIEAQILFVPLQLPR